MTYTDLKKVVGRDACIVVDLQVPRCTRVYGTAPCTAAIGVTGNDRCYNTRKTCQDPANSAGLGVDGTGPTNPIHYRFSSRQFPPPTDPTWPTAIPSVLSVSVAPSKVDPGKSLGVRASCVIRLQDHPWADRDVDPYFRLRSYDAMARGTYWGKWLARNPYYQNRTIDVYTGFLVNGVAIPANFDRRTYVVDKIDGPDASGVVTITAKDPLKLADSSRTQCPLANTGTLETDIDWLAGVFTLLPAGVGNLEYPASGYLSIGSEIMSFARSADIVTIGARGQFGTTVDRHAAGDSVQASKVYASARVIDVIYDLLVNYAGIDPTFITMVDWEAEFDVWIPDFLISATIYKPEGVQKLLDELIEQCLCYIWWDERARQIRFRPVRPPTWDEVVALDETNNVLMDTPKTTIDPAQRISKLYIYYSQRNPTLDLERKDNYDWQELAVDINAEGPDEYGEERIREVYSRWLSKDNGPEAMLLGVRLLNKYRNNPRFMTFELDAKDAELWTADHFTMASRVIQDATGASNPFQMQVLSVTEVELGARFSYESMDAFFQGRYGFVTPVSLAHMVSVLDYWGNPYTPTPTQQSQWTAGGAKPAENIPDYLAASDAQRNRYGFITKNNGTMSNGDGGYKII